jgi:hypothetical protein
MIRWNPFSSTFLCGRLRRVQILGVASVGLEKQEKQKILEAENHLSTGK